MNSEGLIRGMTLPLDVNFIGVHTGNTCHFKFLGLCPFGVVVGLNHHDGARLLEMCECVCVCVCVCVCDIARDRERMYVWVR